MGGTTQQGHIITHYIPSLPNSCCLMSPHPTRGWVPSDMASENCSAFGHKDRSRRRIAMRMEGSTDEAETTFRAFSVVKWGDW